jgi:hypothetical protein
LLSEANVSEKHQSMREENHNSYKLYFICTVFGRKLILSVPLLLTCQLCLLAWSQHIMRQQIYYAEIIYNLNVAGA